MQAFEVDARLSADSEKLTDLPLCELRLMKDGRWPWLVLVPRRPAVSEPFDLSPDDQMAAAAEANRVGRALKIATGADKINIAAIGNIVRQLHIHVVARFEGDPNWPKPVWGFEAALPRDDADKETLIRAISKALDE